VITALTVGAVVAVRPDLVHGARGLRQQLKLRVDGELVDAPAAPTASPSLSPAATPVPVVARSHRKVWIGGLIASLVLAGFVSFYASANPDGLEKIAHDQGIDKKEEPHSSSDSPLAGYGVKDVTDARLSGGLAGVIGVGATVVVGSGVFWVVRRRRTSGPSSASPSAGQTA
jgi:cobalt/nickel transport system permease protein